MLNPLLRKIAAFKNKVQRAAKYDKINVADEVRGVKANFITSRIEKHLKVLERSEVPEIELDSNRASSLVIAQTTFTSVAKNILANLLTLSIIKDGVQTAGTNEEQTISFSAVPDAGAWSLSLGIEQTPSLNFNASASAVQTALRTIAGLETATVTGDYTLGFTVVMAQTSYPVLGVASDTLTASSVAVTITTAQTVAGVPAVNTVRVDVVDSDIKVHCLSGATNNDVKSLIETSPAHALITVSIAAGQGSTAATAALDKPFKGGL